jgi:hypothetical protein
MATRTCLPDHVIDQLPLPGQRWVPSRKAAVIEAVRAGKLSLEEACRRYDLCPDELNSWAAAIDKHGVPGLRATRFQIYRDSPRPQAVNSDGDHPGNHRFF